MFLDNIYNGYLYNNDFDIDTPFFGKSHINYNNYNDLSNTTNFIPCSSNKVPKNSFYNNNYEDKEEPFSDSFKKIFINELYNSFNKELEEKNNEYLYKQKTFNIPQNKINFRRIEDNIINYKIELTNDIFIKDNILFERNIKYNNNLHSKKKSRYFFISIKTIQINTTNNNNYSIEHIDSIYIKNNNLEQINNNIIINIDLSKRAKRIIKNKKNMGRKKKDNIKFNKKVLQSNIHDKYKPDNIRIRYKRCFFKYLIKMINNRISKSPKLNKKGKIKKLKSSIMTNTKKDKTLLMLNLTAREYLSLDIHNKLLIEYIYIKNEISLIEILDKTIRELMIIFCSDLNKYEEYKDFKRLQYHIDNELITKFHEDKEYIALFIDQAIKFEEKYKKLDGRYENG